MKKREQKDNSVEKRSIMYSHLFNYDTMNRDGQRMMETSAAVAGGGKSVSGKKHYHLELCIVAIVVALIFGWSYVRKDVAAAVSEFMLEKDGVEMKLMEPEPLALDVTTFLEEANESRDYYSDEEEIYHHQRYNEWSEVPLLDGALNYIIEEEDMWFSLFDMRIYSDNKLGKLQVNVIEKRLFKNVQYELNGIFKIAGYTNDNIILADKGELATFAYEAESGNKAYFVRNWKQGTYTVYFVVDDILFEMEISSSKKSVKSAKKIFEAMAASEKASVYENLFEYAIDLTDEEYAYAPTQLKFGMTMEEVLQAEGLDESAILKEDSEIVYHKKMYKNVSDAIEEIILCKRFIVSEEYGLGGVYYDILVDKEDYDEVRALICDQAEAYMSEPPMEGSLEEFRKSGGSVRWEEKEMVEGKQMPKCTVLLGTDAKPEGYEDTKVQITIGVSSHVAWLALR